MPWSHENLWQKGRTVLLGSPGELCQVGCTLLAGSARQLC